MPALARPGRFCHAAYRDLRIAAGPARLFALTTLRARHRRSVFGYIWLLVPALATAAICATLRNSHIIAVGGTPIPYPLFALAGMLLWQGFIDGLGMPNAQIMANRYLLTRTPIPHEAVLLAGLYDLGLNATTRLVVLLILLAASGVPVMASWAFVPVGAALLIALGVALGLVLSPLSILYDDVGRAIGLIASFGLLLTPVLYPLPAGSWLWLNPVSPLIDGTRGWVVGSTPRVGLFVVGAASLSGMVVGWLLYRLARPRLIERLG